jgi:hypothetical protein
MEEQEQQEQEAEPEQGGRATKRARRAEGADEQQEGGGAAAPAAPAAATATAAAAAAAPAAAPEPEAAAGGGGGGGGGALAPIAAALHRQQGQQQQGQQQPGQVSPAVEAQAVAATRTAIVRSPEEMAHLRIVACQMGMDFFKLAIDQRKGQYEGIADEDTRNMGVWACETLSQHVDDVSPPPAFWHWLSLVRPIQPLTIFSLINIQYTPSVVAYIEATIATGTVPPMITSHVRTVMGKRVWTTPSNDFLTFHPHTQKQTKP